jgi:hypothetical protein
MLLRTVGVKTSVAWRSHLNMDITHCDCSFVTTLQEDREVHTDVCLEKRQVTPLQYEVTTGLVYPHLSGYKQPASQTGAVGRGRDHTLLDPSERFCVGNAIHSGSQNSSGGSSWQQNETLSGTRYCATGRSVTSRNNWRSNYTAA